MRIDCFEHAILVIAAILGTGCSGSPSHPPPPPDDSLIAADAASSARADGSNASATADDAASDDAASSDGAAECGSDLSLGDSVTGIYDTGSVPDQQGGTIADGTYQLTAHIYYSNDASVTGSVPDSASRQTLSIADGRFVWTMTYNDEVPRTYAGTLTTTPCGARCAGPTTAVFAVACGPAGHSSGPQAVFTATDTELRMPIELFAHPATAKYGDIAVFTRQ
jgi:hypothetical protein